MRTSFKIAEQIIRDHNAIVRTAQAKRLGIDPKTLSDMLAAGLLVKESRGIYRLASLPPIGNPDVVQVSLRAPRAVICLISALSFHNLTTQIPRQVYIALPRGAYPPYIKYPPLDITWLSVRPYQAGIEEYSLDNIAVRIYNREKTIADCFKFRRKVGEDVALEALKDYLQAPGRNIEELLRYARINRVANIMRPYLEAAV